MAKLPTRKKIFLLVGEGSANCDGKSRQDVLAVAMPGAAVSLTRQPENKADSNAIFVELNGEGIGYLSRADAAVIAVALDSGRLFAAKLDKLSGGVVDAEFYGAEISISWDGQPPLPHKELDPAQTKFRHVRLSRGTNTKQKQRGAKGQFVGDKSKSGCLGSLILFGLGLLGITALATNLI
jgi:HIRAN domain